MSASGTLKACGMPTWKIWAMWLTMFCGTGAGAIVGSAAFAPPTNEAEELAAAYGFATIVGLCGGATIAMARGLDSQPRAGDAQPREGCARCSLWWREGGPAAAFALVLVARGARTADPHCLHATPSAEPRRRPAPLCMAARCRTRSCPRRASPEGTWSGFIN